MSTGKPLAEVRAKYDNFNRRIDLIAHTRHVCSPAQKHVGSPGLAALLEHITDETFKSSAHLAEVLNNPKIAASAAPDETPFSVSHGTELGYWDWIEQPDKKSYLERFSVAIGVIKTVLPDELILRGL